MSDRDALLAAICAQPDEDTTRLVFADWCDENDEPDRAAFIRTQVELARTPPWEPFAVRCRWREPDALLGKRFAAELPRVDGFHIAWSATPFRRGFGWALLVRSVSEWRACVEPLFECEPIGRVAFWQGQPDEWGRVASSGCLEHLREVTFNVSPIEPLRALRDEPTACGVTDIRFQRASGAGMPEVLEDLFRAPLGRTVRGLHFHTGYESLNEQIEALNTRGPLERLSFSVMGITVDHVPRLFAGPVGAALSELHLRREPLGDDGLQALAPCLPGALRDLTLMGTGIRRADGFEALARCSHLTELRRLNLSNNPLAPRAVKVLALARSLAGLRSLDLSECGIGDKGVRHVVAAKFWPNLVELDLGKNQLSDVGVRHLLDAPVPPDLTALVLTGDALGADARTALAKKFGAAVVFVTEDGPGW
jgi:uncharacterized protein (TIGR02996 family)